MSRRAALAKQVAAAIGDGHAIEWERLRDLAKSPAERSLLEQFQGVAAIERASRTVSSRVLAYAAPERQAIWWSTIIALALLQSAIGAAAAIGVVLGPGVPDNLLWFQLTIFTSFSAVSIFLLTGG